MNWDYWLHGIEFHSPSIPIVMSLAGLLGLLIIGDEWTRVFALIMLETAGILVALINLNAGENAIVWNGVAFAMTIPLMHELDRMNILNGRWPRKERKLLKKLFGEPTNIWEMFMMDPRLRRNAK